MADRNKKREESLLEILAGLGADIGGAALSIPRNILASTIATGETLRDPELRQGGRTFGTGVRKAFDFLPGVDPTEEEAEVEREARRRALTQIEAVLGKDTLSDRLFGFNQGEETRFVDEPKNQLARDTANSLSFLAGGPVKQAVGSAPGVANLAPVLQRILGRTASGATEGVLSGIGEDQDLLTSAGFGAAGENIVGGALDVLSAGGKKIGETAAGKKLIDIGGNIKDAAFSKKFGGAPTASEGGRNLLRGIEKAGLDASNSDSLLKSSLDVIERGDGAITGKMDELTNRGVISDISDIRGSELTSKLKTNIDRVAEDQLLGVRADLDFMLEKLGTSGDSLTPAQLFKLKQTVGTRGWDYTDTGRKIWRGIYDKLNTRVDDVLKKAGFRNFSNINETITTAFKTKQFVERTGKKIPATPANISLTEAINPALGVTRRALSIPQVQSAIGGGLEAIGNIPGRPALNLPAGAQDLLENLGGIGAAQLAPGQESIGAELPQLPEEEPGIANNILPAQIGREDDAIRGSRLGFVEELKNQGLEPKEIRDRLTEQGFEAAEVDDLLSSAGAQFVDDQGNVVDRPDPNATQSSLLRDDQIQDLQKLAVLQQSGLGGDDITSALIEILFREPPEVPAEAALTTLFKGGNSDLLNLKDLTAKEAEARAQAIVEVGPDRFRQQVPKRELFGLDSPEAEAQASSDELRSFLLSAQSLFPEGTQNAFSGEGNLTGPFTAKTTSIGQALGFNESSRARAQSILANFSSERISDLSGAAVSVFEEARLNKFLPRGTDSEARVADKLVVMERVLNLGDAIRERAKRANLTEGEYIQGNKDALLREFKLRSEDV